MVINYISALTVFLQNFTTEYGGRGAVAVAVGIACSVSFVSDEYLVYETCANTWQVMKLEIYGDRSGKYLR